jgi:putative FmdB family regulatory protein
MPIYEYRCRKCQKSFEQLILSSQDKAACPQCDSTKVERLVSVFNSRGDSGETVAAGGGGGCGCTPQSCGVSKNIDEN